MYRLLYPNDPLPEVSSTFRGKADQDREVAEGESKLPWPLSTHNYLMSGIPASLSLDFYFVENGKASYKRPWMERVVNLSRLVGLFSGSVWGWDWPHLALCEKVSDLSSASYLLPAIPALPGEKLAKSASEQPVLKYYDAAGTAQVMRGEGDILIRLGRDKDANGATVLHLRYDEPDDGK